MTVPPIPRRWNEGASDFVGYVTFMQGLGLDPLDVLELHRIKGGSLVQIDVAFARRGSEWLRHAQDNIENLGKKSMKHLATR